MLDILHVVFGCIPGAFFGGVSKVVFELARAQGQLGCHVKIATTNYSAYLNRDIPCNRTIKCGPVEIAYYQAQRWPELRSTALKKVIAMTAHQYDVLHTHNTFLSFNRYVRMAAVRAGRPYFVHPHGALDSVVLRRGLIKYIKKRIYILLIERRNLNRAAGVFAFTRREEDQLRTLRVRSPIHILPNGIEILKSVDPRRFRLKWNIPAESHIILFLGRIDQKKGIDVLIEGFARVTSHWPTARLVVSGDRSKDISYNVRLAKICKERSIEERVIWTGFLDEQAKVEAMSAATVFSHVSRSEGMAMAILEGMAAGLPVIVSDGCYMDRAVQEGAVALSKYDPICLGHKIEELLADRELRDTMSKTAKAYVAANHSWEAIARDSLEIYSTALKP